MPSIIKTPFMELNQWSGNEYPKRIDFVEDNQKIDTHIQGLSESSGDLITRLNLLEQMIFKNDFYAALGTDDPTTTILVDNNGDCLLADWKFKEV